MRSTALNLGLFIGWMTGGESGTGPSRSSQEVSTEYDDDDPLTDWVLLFQVFKRTPTTEPILDFVDSVLRMPPYPEYNEESRHVIPGSLRWINDARITTDAAGSITEMNLKGWGLTDEDTPTTLAKTEFFCDNLWA